MGEGGGLGRQGQSGKNWNHHNKITIKHFKKKITKNQQLSQKNVTISPSASEKQSKVVHRHGDYCLEIVQSRIKPKKT